MTTENENLVEQIQKAYEKLSKSVAKWIEFPEPALKLNIKARQQNKVRMFKYLHQMNLMHSEHFVTACQIKLPYLIKGYLDMVQSKNPIGIFLFSRSLLELLAFIREVKERLLKVTKKPENRWREKGEEFFGIIVRARYGTSNLILKKELQEKGVSKKYLDPINVMTALENLAEDKKWGELANKYDSFCDVVHHNLSSHMQSNEGFSFSSVASSQGGGQIWTKKPGLNAFYRYPIESRAKLAVEETQSHILKCIEGIEFQINSFPKTPFSLDQIYEMTGTHLGIEFLGWNK